MRWPKEEQRVQRDGRFQRSEGLVGLRRWGSRRLLGGSWGGGHVSPERVDPRHQWGRTRPRTGNLDGAGHLARERSR